MKIGSIVAIGMLLIAAVILTLRNSGYAFLVQPLPNLAPRKVEPLSRRPLSEDELTIYRSYLSQLQFVTYPASRSDIVGSIQLRTESVVRSYSKADLCLSGFQLDRTDEVHELPASILPVNRHVQLLNIPRLDMSKYQPRYGDSEYVPPPDMYVFSEIVFTADRQKAGFTVEYASPPEGSFGSFVSYEKRFGNWVKIEPDCGLWVS